MLRQERERKLQNLISPFDLSLPSFLVCLLVQDSNFITKCRIFGFTAFVFVCWGFRHSNLRRGFHVSALNSEDQILASCQYFFFALFYLLPNQSLKGRESSFIKILITKGDFSFSFFLFLFSFL